MTRPVEVYVRSGRWLLASSVRAPEGWWSDSSPYVDLGEDPPADTVGRVVMCLMSLDAGSAQEGDDPVKPLMKLVGARSVSAFYEHTLHASVQQVEDKVVVMPLRKTGPRTFVYTKDEITLDKGAPPDVVAWAIRQALGIA